MVQDLLSAVRIQELHILTIQIFTESNLPYEVDNCYRVGCLLYSSATMAFEVELHSIAAIVGSRYRQ